MTQVQQKLVDVRIKPVKERSLSITIENRPGSSLIQHQWDEKARAMLRDKHAGKKTKNREVREPDKEAEAATYRTVDGQYGIPAGALKASIIGAAHKDLGIEKTLVRKSFFIRCDDPHNVLVMKCDEPFTREDPVRVGASTDLRYRPEFSNWELTFEVEYDPNLLQPDDIFALVTNAGFGVGLCEWRPEKGGEHGRFQLKDLTT